MKPTKKVTNKKVPVAKKEDPMAMKKMKAKKK